MSVKSIFFLASVSGALAVALGAFGAHALKERFSDYQMAIFETGVRYQWYHTFALFLAGLLALQGFDTALSSYLFATGILLFSGSLYLLAGTAVKYLGAITPIGGTLWILAWLLLARSVYRA